MICGLFAPVMADDFGFSDFKPDDPIGVLKEIVCME